MPNSHMPSLPSHASGAVLHRFAHPAQMAVSAAQTIAAQLRAGLQANPRATLVVSGGQTPVPIWHVLSQADLPWERVDITLADERWVPVNHPDSNEALVRRHLLQSCASRATWWPLYEAGADLHAVVAEKARQLRQAMRWPADVVMLGMGADGHTASWFPGSALLHDEQWCMAVAAPALPNVVQPRLSLTPRALLDAGKVVVLVQGANKEATLGRALLPTLACGGGMPIQQALQQTLQPCDVFFAP